MLARAVRNKFRTVCGAVRYSLEVEESLNLNKAYPPSTFVCSLPLPLCSTLFFLSLLAL